MGFPSPDLFAWAAALSEFLGGILIALGLGTRIAAFFVFSTMTVAVFIRHASDTFDVKELALLYGTIAMAIVLIGPGRFSLDYLICKRCCKKS
jgi:putative oxidoreductase